MLWLPGNLENVDFIYVLSYIGIRSYQYGAGLMKTNPGKNCFSGVI